MKTALSVLAAVLITGLVCFVLSTKGDKSSQQRTHAEQSRLVLIVERAIEGESRRIVDQLSAFSAKVAGARDFSMKLLVENNPTSPEVSDFASQYMEPMGFSMLTILDSIGTILSSGHFPSGAGSLAAKHDLAQGTFMVDTVHGQEFLTLQATKDFAVSEIPLSCAGGHIIDRAFLSRLPIGPGFRLVFKYGDKFVGGDSIRAISEFKDNSMIMNDKKYAAFTVPVRSADPSDPVQLFVLFDTPESKP